MRLYLIFTVLVLTLGSAAHADPLPNPYFFSLEKEGRTFFLFGSRHLGVSLSDVPNYVTNALQHSNTFIEESVTPADPSKTDDGKLLASAKSPFPNQDAIEKLVQRGIPRAKISVTPNSILCLAYTNLEDLKSIGANGGLTLDQQLEKTALDNQKQILGLDNADQSDDAVAGVLGSCDINDLTSKLSPEQAAKNREVDRSRYIGGDLNDQCDANDKSNKAGVRDRNLTWIGKISQLKDRGAFITVGAGHLGCSNGLIQLLTEQGFKVTRIHSQQQVDQLLSSPTSVSEIQDTDGSITQGAI